MPKTILVTGPTGTIGSQVVSLLAKHGGVTVRAGVRDAKKAADLPAGVTAVDFDYDKPETLAKACEGVDHLFLLTPFTQDQVELARRLIDAAKAAGVQHIVKLSAIGAEVEPGIQLGRWHRAIEKNIEASGIGWTFLRPNNFMENFIGYYPPDKEGAIYLPIGEGAVSWIAAEDVAAVAVAALTSPGHEGKAYVLTGPEALSISAVAKAISDASGRTIRYVDIPEDAAKNAMLGFNMPMWMVDGMMELHGIAKPGYAAAVTSTVKDVTGKAPQTFAEWSRAHASSWKV